MGISTLELTKLMGLTSEAKGIYTHVYGDVYSDYPTDSTRYEGLEDVQ